MKMYKIPHTDLSVSRIAYGCMNLGGPWHREPLDKATKKKAVTAVQTALEAGINFFDHADIYVFGKSEMAFTAIWQALPGIREELILQSKCGIRFQDDPAGAPGRYDFSYQHIIRSVDGILKRLQTDYLDILLLHRPDALVEPEEVARAFSELHHRGKVRYFGVSNHTPGQILLLQKFVDQPLIVNQVELNLLHAHLINEGVIANQVDAGCHLAAGTLDFCRLHDMLIQAWSPVAGGLLLQKSAQADTPALRDLLALIEKMAGAHQTTPEGIVLGWLLRHPAPVQPIIGTTRPERIRAAAAADQVELTREEWYRLFIAARGKPMP